METSRSGMCRWVYDKEPVWAEFEAVKKIFVFPDEMRSLFCSASAGIARPPVPGNVHS